MTPEQCLKQLDAAKLDGCAACVAAHLAGCSACTEKAAAKKLYAARCRPAPPRARRRRAPAPAPVHAAAALPLF